MTLPEDFLEFIFAQTSLLLNTSLFANKVSSSCCCVCQCFPQTRINAPLCNQNVLLMCSKLLTYVLTESRIVFQQLKRQCTSRLIIFGIKNKWPVFMKSFPSRLWPLAASNTQTCTDGGALRAIWQLVFCSERLTHREGVSGFNWQPWYHWVTSQVPRQENKGQGIMLCVSHQWSSPLTKFVVSVWGSLIAFFVLIFEVSLTCTPTPLTPLCEPGPAQAFLHLYSKPRFWGGFLAIVACWGSGPGFCQVPRENFD